MLHERVIVINHQRSKRLREWRWAVRRDFHSVGARVDIYIYHAIMNSTSAAVHDVDVAGHVSWNT
jgi:hypothetical protein